MLSGRPGGAEIIRSFKEYDISDQNTDSKIKEKHETKVNMALNRFLMVQI